MKRTANLARRTPLRASTGLLRTVGLRPQSARRKAEQRVRRANLLAAFGPDPLCVRCGRPADDGHEIVSRARGGSARRHSDHGPGQRPCHSWITDHPAAAAAEGLSKSSWERAA